jgi:uncharacterized protein YycO
MNTPLPGDIVFVQIPGCGGWFLRFAQALTGDWSRFTHAGVVVDNNNVVAAYPGGAKIEPLSNYMSQKLVAFSQYDLDDATRAKIVENARKLEGTPYSFLDYLSIALLTWHIRPKWVVDYVKNTGHMICSQLADSAYKNSGIELFSDDRWEGDCTPGDLAQCGLIMYPPGPIFYAKEK